MTPAPYRVLIAHPERQHSHHLALGLSERGRLLTYLHGAPLPAEIVERIPAALRRPLSFCRRGRQLLGLTRSPRLEREGFYRLSWLYDRRIADMFENGCEADAVVAYENSARLTFRAARARGVACVLDHASVHHAFQDAMTVYPESEALHRRVIAGKDEELEFADLILACSSFAADTFIRNGVPAGKIVVVPPGADSSAFSPVARDVSAAGGASGGSIRFIFVGRLRQSKGADVLAAAAERLHHEALPFGLTVVAALAEADPALITRMRKVAKLTDKVFHSEIPRLHAGADCLVLPSRFDSFAFVVAEAMASGLPVIVSDHVGAKDMIEEAVNGWIVPAGDVDALTERMRWCADHPDAVRAMGPAARRAAEGWTWARYHERAIGALDDLMARRHVQK